ncbi:hypothetical protein [Caulobacter sp. NIBR1757]|uniref:hypothetical protein n=1 Tax=Caulobacter sp. NIBR1757 TaxID=3016000 RepID=UPI0022F116AD|nr:hypothetical protein [Caulobacter sp. NIBR1757]WGM38018.1 hypothetical protein AMEJIAPC_00919 [Caulobacter sp. NIBR1757]
MSLRRLLSVGVAVAALITPSLAAAAPAVDPRDKPRPDVSGSLCPSWDPQVLKPGDDVHVGSIKRSRCHIAHLRDFAAADRTDWPEVRVTTRELARLYEARAGRQQAWIDGSTLFTSGASLGYIGSTGVSGTMTLSYLGAAALLPVLTSQFVAHEPTRDLYHAGAIGLSQIAARYEGLWEISDTLDRYALGSVDADAGAVEVLRSASNACGEVPHALDLLDGALNGGAESKALLEQAKVLYLACEQYQGDLRTLASQRAALRLALRRATVSYATDVIALDSLIMQADRQLRATPLKALTTMAASPFNSASTLLTGDNGQAAIAKLKAQEVFGDLSMTLSPIRLRPTPTPASRDTALPLDSLFAIEAGLSKVIAAPTKPKGAKATKAEAAEAKAKAAGDRALAKDAAKLLRSAARELIAARSLVTDQFVLMALADKLVASTALDFSCDIKSRKVKVVLDGPKPPPTLENK